LTERITWVATRVQADLIEKGIDVDLLKEFDSRLNNYQASALVSIHADSCDYINDQATGFKVASALANPRPERAARLTACLRNRYAKATNLPLHNSITIDMTSHHARRSTQTTAAIVEGILNLDRQVLTQNTDVVAWGSQMVFCASGTMKTSLPNPVHHRPRQPHPRPNHEQPNRPFHLLLERALPGLYSGDRSGARRLGQQAAALDPDQEEIWLLLAAVSSPKASLIYLKRALEINPSSQRARQGMHWAIQRARLSKAEAGADLQRQPAVFEPSSRPAPTSPYRPPRKIITQPIGTKDR
jgi:hypothetical protein